MSSTIGANDDQVKIKIFVANLLQQVETFCLNPFITFDLDDTLILFPSDIEGDPSGIERFCNDPREIAKYRLTELGKVVVPLIDPLIIVTGRPAPHRREAHDALVRFFKYQGAKNVIISYADKFEHDNYKMMDGDKVRRLKEEFLDVLYDRGIYHPMVVHFDDRYETIERLVEKQKLNKHIKVIGVKI